MGFGISMKDATTTAIAAACASVFAWTPFIEQFHKSFLMPLATVVGILWIAYQFYQKAFKGK
jgi:hypothetical protein